MRLIPAGLFILLFISSLVPVWGQSSILIPIAGAPINTTERILSYKTVITMKTDGWLEVQEDISVLNNGQNMPDGFILYFANSRYDNLGLRRVLTPQIKQVLRDGMPETYRTEKTANETLLIISGVSGRYAPGTYNYTIRYLIDGQLLQLPENDEFRWDVRGDDGILGADSVSISVTLPDGISNANVSPFARVSALKGDTSEFTITPVSNNGFTCTANRPLLSGENLSFGLTLPPYLLLRLSAGQLRQQVLHDNPEIFWAITFFVVVLLYFLIVWAAVGRDPKAGKRTPRFTPPVGLSPAAVRYLRHLHHDDIGVATAIINAATHGLVKISDYTSAFRIMRTGEFRTPIQRLVLAELKRGYVITYSELAQRIQVSEEQVKQAVQRLIDEESVPIIDKKGKIRLEKTPGLELPDSDTPLSAEEYAVLNCLLPGESMTIMADKSSQEQFYFARKALRASLEAGYEKRYFSTNSSFFAVGLIISILGLFPAGLMVMLSDQNGFSPWLAVAGMGITALVFFNSLLPAWKRVFGGGRHLRKSLLWLIPITLLFGGLAFYCSDLLAPPPVYLGIYIVVLLTLNILFHHLLTAMTEAGRAILDIVEGFRAYLTGDAHLPEAPITGAQFEACLPYALAMDVPDNWTAHFVHLAQGDESGKPYCPAWFTGEAWKAGKLENFVHALHADFAMSINAIPDAPPPTTAALQSLQE